MSDTDLRALSSLMKSRRVEMPGPGDEWPGTWRYFDSGATRLPSFINDDGTKIRVNKRNRVDEPAIRAFVHGTEETEFGPAWTGADIHDDLVDYMEAHP